MLKCFRTFGRATLIIALGCKLSGGFVSLAKETTDAKPAGELTALELLAQTGAGTETNQTLRLRGADARQQLLVNAKFSATLPRTWLKTVWET